MINFNFGKQIVVQELRALSIFISLSFRIEAEHIDLILLLSVTAVF
jgi:hypothetical protein